MKLRNKEISLIIASVIFAFFGLAEAAAEGNRIFDTIEIRNNVKFNIELYMRQDSTATSGRHSPEKDIRLSVNAGESKLEPIQGEIDSTIISLSTKDENVSFERMDSYTKYIESERPTLYKFDVIENDDYEGLFYVVTKKIDNVLKVTIDSLYGNLVHEFEVCDLE